MDAQNNKQTLDLAVSWSLLHFKQHVQASLHADVELILQPYSSIQRRGEGGGGPLYFSILTRQLVVSNQQSCVALVSLVQAYNISADGNGKPLTCHQAAQ